MTYTVQNTITASTTNFLGVAKVTEEVLFWFNSTDYQFGTIASGSLATMAAAAALPQPVISLIPVSPSQVMGTAWVGQVLGSDKLAAITLDPVTPSMSATLSAVGHQDYVQSATPIDNAVTTLYSYVLSNGVGGSLCSGTIEGTRVATGTGSHTKVKGHQYLVRWVASGTSVSFIGAEKVAEYWEYSYPPDNDQDTYYTLRGWIPYEDMTIWVWSEYGAYAEYAFKPIPKFEFGGASFGSGESARYQEDLNFNLTDYPAGTALVTLGNYRKNVTVANINFLATQKMIGATSERFVTLLGGSIASNEQGLTFPPLNRFAANIVAYPMGYRKILLGVSISTSNLSANNFLARSYIMEYEFTPDQGLCADQIDYGDYVSAFAGTSVNGVFSMKNGTEGILSWRDNDGGADYKLTLYKGLTGVTPPDPPPQNRLWLFKTSDGGNSWTNRGVALEPPPPEETCIDEEF